jgi:hypothetical protein
MTVLFGSLAAVDGENTVINWSAAFTADNKDVPNASNMQRGTVRLEGRKDWTGDFECATAEPVVMPGEAFTFEGSIDGALGVSGAAVSESMDTSCDVAGGGPITCKVAFGGNGAPTKGAVVVADATDPNPYNGLNGKAATGTKVASPVFTDLTDVTKWSLKISAKNKKYGSSSTAKQNKREPGHIDCSASVSYYFATPATLPVEGSTIALKLFVSDTECWELWWMIIDSVTDIKVDPNSQEPVGCTINVSWSAFTDIAGTATIGKIITPAGTTFWPAA